MWQHKVSVFSLFDYIRPDSGLCLDVHKIDAETGIALDKSGEAKGEANIQKVDKLNNQQQYIAKLEKWWS